MHRIRLAAATDTRKEETQEKETSRSGKRYDSNEQLVTTFASLFKFIFD
jgi:hypothetical protein